MYFLATKTSTGQSREHGEGIASQRLCPVSEGYLRNVTKNFPSLRFGNYRFGKRGGPPSRSNMIHDSQMDYSEGSDGFLPPRPLPCTPDYLLTLATFEEKYEHIRQCTGARRNHLGMRRPTRSRESGYVRYG